MYYLALHADQREWKMALIEKDKKNFKILELDTSIVKLLDILSQKNPCILVTGIDSWDIFLREFSFKLRFKREILSVLPFQIESQLPHPLNELILLPIFHKKKDAATSVSLFALRKERLKKHLESFHHLKVDPDVVSSIPSALSRFAVHYFPDHSSLIVFHLGLEKSSYIAISEGNIILSQTQNFGVLSDSLDAFEKDLERHCVYLKKKCPAISKILITGEAGAGLPVTEMLSKVFGAHFSLLKFSKGHEKLKKHAIPLGLCLDAFKQDKQSIQFRVGPFVSEKKIQKRTKWIKNYLAACLGLLLITSVGGQFYLKKKENLLTSLLSSVYPEAKNHSMDDAIFKFESSLSKDKSSFPYAVNVPKVSDVLAWLGDHPKLAGAQITHLHYLLVKYPKLESPFSPYQAHVELSFKTDSSRMAREFHDALLKGDGIVNAKQEIKWNADQNNYHTSFYLTPLKIKKSA